jgi:hypothetical protein
VNQISVLFFHLPFSLLLIPGIVPKAVASATLPSMNKLGIISIGAHARQK